MRSIVTTRFATGRTIGTTIFTPSTKAEVGSHDVNVNFDAIIDLVGTDVATAVRDLSLHHL